MKLHYNPLRPYLYVLTFHFIDLPNLLNQYNLTYKDIDKECDEGLFTEVSQHVDDYMKVGHGLNLPNEILTNISQNKKDDIEKKIATLWAWKRKNGSVTTSRELVKVFFKTGRSISSRIHFEIPFKAENIISSI